MLFHILKDKQLIIEILLPCATHTAVTLMFNSLGNYVNLTVISEYRIKKMFKINYK